MVGRRPSGSETHGGAGVDVLVLPVTGLAAADDTRISFLEQEVRNLQRELQVLSRAGEMHSSAVRAGPRRADRRRDRRAARRSRLAQWVNAPEWKQLHPGMSELEVIGLLGPPTSIRDEAGGRVLFYAMEIDSSAFLGGSVRMRDRAVDGGASANTAVSKRSGLADDPEGAEAPWPPTAHSAALRYRSRGAALADARPWLGAAAGAVSSLFVCAGDGCAPRGDAAPGARLFPHRRGPQSQQFLREGPVAAHLLLRSGTEPRLLVAFPAGNSARGTLVREDTPAPSTGSW